MNHSRRSAQSFSALQRAENSSILCTECRKRASIAFQCSSASRKFLNERRNADDDQTWVFQCSSASRKFLNSRCVARRTVATRTFQCSSASRKFLNPDLRRQRCEGIGFQCSSASRKFLNSRRIYANTRHVYVSVLFSEPKIPQSRTITPITDAKRVSVLFSEPKIPQFVQRERRRGDARQVSVLFSEPKIPQFRATAGRCTRPSRRFSALQRAENSSILFLSL